MLCALIVDPDAAADAAEDLWTDLPHRMRDFREQGELLNQGPMAMDRLLEVIAAWIRFGSEKHWMKSVASYNRLLGIWCASYVLSKKLPEINPLNMDLAMRAARSFCEAVKLCVMNGIDTDQMYDSKPYTEIMERPRSLVDEYVRWSSNQELYELAENWLATTSLFRKTLEELSEGTALIRNAGNDLSDAMSNVHWMVAGAKVSRMPPGTFSSDEQEQDRYTMLAKEELSEIRSIAAEACLRFPH